MVPGLRLVNHAGSSGGLSEGKGTAWDGGTRDTLFYPLAGKSSSRSYLQPTADTDGYFANDCSSNKCAYCPNKKLMGLNFLPLLTGKSS